ncbi:hypothetical protein CVT24_012466 [Panaeolus cyanescens]|uniref:Helicase C-terminal domain-containing protein n=1 Tax=Panaeolus cyanescens TaxID=181874 RepID=A0A409WUC9_9AGAR|nr:hypothetical protein CVT24_012466 [Panaeolus cyanescens]
MRARLPSKDSKFVPLITTSATIREGDAKKEICKVLGLEDGQYHMIRRSNMRYDIQIIFIEMTSGIGSLTFPELAWVLDSDHKTVIFAKTISLGFRIASYLWTLGLAKQTTDLPNRIRLMSSLNWPSYNEATLGFLNNNSNATITISTDILSVGWDSPDTRDAIIFGEPPDVDEFMQKIGRVGRNRELVKDPRAIIYYSKTSKSNASKMVHQPMPHPATTQPLASDASTVLDISMAKLLEASCYPAEIDAQYNNPAFDEPCTCPKCTASTPATKPLVCDCSGCLDISSAAFDFLRVRPPKVVKPSRRRARAGEGIGKEMRELAEDELGQVQMNLYRQGGHGFLPPQAIFPSHILTKIIDNIYDICRDSDNLSSILDQLSWFEASSIERQKECQDALLEKCKSLIERFTEIRKRKKQGGSEGVDNSEEEKESEEELMNETRIQPIATLLEQNDEEIIVAAPQKLVIRIPSRKIAC